MDDYAADLHDLMRGLSLQRAVFAGLSMGGYVLFALQRRAPDVVRGMVLVDTKAQADTPEGRAGRERMIDLVGREGAAGVAREMLPRLLSDDTRRNRPELAERVRAIMEANGPVGIEDALRAMMTRPDSTPLLAGIQVPVLIVVGEADALTPVGDSEVMHRQLPRSRLVVVPGAGHLSSLERPDVLNAELSQWLLELSEAES
jgi:pimeloyl-ACP methyl ester carboxylesterase